MLKRLLSLFRRRTTTPILGVRPSGPEVTPSEEPASAGEAFISAYDAFGREVKIAREEWREKILSPNLIANWSNPDGLSSLILSAINDGFAAEVLESAKRLVVIDPNPERGHTVYGIALMKNRKLHEAEATLRTGMVKAGETGVLLTNLAKVMFDQGDEMRADEILWRALQKDPNLDNALMWWLAIERDRGGETGYVQGLHTVSALAGSWRAHLWLAQHYLQASDLVNARRIYERVLGEGLFDGSGLMMISGDLANYGHIQLIPELVGPVYQPTRHGPEAGLNLLRAFEVLHLVEQGEALLAELYAMGAAPLKQQLDEFAHAFQRLGAAADVGTPIDLNEIETSTRSFTRPIWHYGLRNATWLFRQKPDSAAQVGFFAFSKKAMPYESSEEQREDEVGRMTRAIPLYLAEATHYWTDSAATTFVAVIDGSGPVVFGVEPEGDDLFDLVPETMHYFVTGQVGCTSSDGGGVWTLSVRLWDCARRELAASQTATCALQELGAVVLKLEQRLLASLSGLRADPFDDFYRRPSIEAMTSYLPQLGQAFMLTLIANEGVPKHTLYGERAMLDYPLSMALHWSTAEVPKLMYIAGLGNAMDYRSDVLMEYKERTLQLLKDAATTKSPAARLAPLIWSIFGMQEELAEYCQYLPPDTQTEYRDWVHRMARTPVC